MDSEQDPDPLVKGTDLRIQIRTKMSRIRNTAINLNNQHKVQFCSHQGLLIEAIQFRGWIGIMERILTGTLKNKMFSAVVLGFKHRYRYRIDSIKFQLK
jgi:hypothetical protein